MVSIAINAALIRQILPITNGIKIIEKPIFGPLVNKLQLGRKVNWDTSLYELESAALRVKADQDVTSGASLTVTVNEEVQSPPLRWHAIDTADKDRLYQITSLIVRGENVYIFAYEVSALHQQAATLSFSATLELLFKPLGKGGDSTPADQGKEEDKDRWAKFTKSLQDNLKLIAIIATAGAAIGGISYLYWKTSVFSKLMRFAK
jgi:hypothetical protein